MTAPRDDSGPRTLARFTPDSRRWRRLVAGTAAVGAPLALYAAVAIVSGVKTGMVYNLLVLLFGLLALVLPAVAAVTLLAPDSGLTGTDATRSEDAVEVLKRRYATGEVDREEFCRRLDDLVGGASDGRGRTDSGSVGSRGTDRELDRTGR